MKRLFSGTALAALLALGFASTASASASLELVVGNLTNFSTLYVPDGGLVTCTDVGTSTACGSASFPLADGNGFANGISLSGVVFGGFDITTTAGGGNPPGCTGINGPGCLNTTNITATNISTGTATLSMYFADTGFTTTTGLIVGFSTPGETGTTANQTAYATTGAVNPLAAGVFSPTGGLSTCGTAPLSIPGPTSNTSKGSSCGNPGTPFSLELATTMTAGVGQAFNLNGTISSAIPEPASVALFGTILVLCGITLRRRSQVS